MDAGFDALKTWEAVREFALSLPETREEFPWGESVAKVNKKVFVFLGSGDGGRAPGFTVKLTDEDVHADALAAPGAEPAGYGLGRSGWVTVPLREGTPAVEVLCDWIADSYRAVAPKRLAARLDGSRPE
ncbi:MmcQ/YjbR family DNA-binding protein [Streptantibioticus ferralitis]|uniref:MmcQ/YjbR family DNA-binding protein n=1 Tax=Streptantibioticus ferralitis TaxID=236510 RepID=A0ABT5Z6D5_9ACTN|nr:MmcQ/YjbR family DNA-binding protein [Streptantibioticus ferralitis]MDF2259392.1 MmcQ/YjbR family DNA-binding protein [Streptantibioticus ferralitis]